MDLHYYILIWICIIGLCLGSFYNVVILRSLSGESIVMPPSKCPKCGHKLYWWHNIPIISYLLLRGKCFFCKNKISIQYPIVEIITMLLFALAFLKFGIEYKTIFVLFWISCLIIMTTTDIKEKIADCNIAIILAISGIVCNFTAEKFTGVIDSVLGLIAGVLIIELIARSGYLFTKSRAMGEADSYVAGALGAIAGLKGLFSILLYGFTVYVIFILPLFFYNKYKSGNKYTCISGILFICSTLAYYKLSKHILLMLAVLLTGLLFAFSTMKGIREEKNRNYLPFIPALSAGLLWYLFF